MKEWLTAREIAAEKLPDMPATESAVIRRADREGWDGTSAARKREGRGGATEYHLSVLPVLAQAAYSQKHLTVDLANDNAVARAAKPALAPALTARAGEERDARLAIVHAFKKFLPKLGYASRVQVFTDRYNAGSIEVAAFVRETVPSVSKRSLARWMQAARDGKQIGHDPASARKGTGVLETANGGALKRHMLGLIAHQPHLCADEVRTQCEYEFGPTIKVVSKGVEAVVPLPPVRTLKQLKATHNVELIKLTNPDLYRSTLAPTGIGMLRHVTEANQLWQIDASPVDALCIDGRHSIYVCLDVATRRETFLLSRTPRASAVALLIRKAVMDWGVPGIISTDNGSDFVARDTQRLFASLGIEPDVCEAYTPEQKGHVERAIRTFQHRVGPLLPGYVGHSVADRTAIEGRKSFAKRLGETENETFGVSLTAAQLRRRRPSAVCRLRGDLDKHFHRRSSVLRDLLFVDRWRGLLQERRCRWRGDD